jgi:hypothetical protein
MWIFPFDQIDHTVLNNNYSISSFPVLSRSRFLIEILDHFHFEWGSDYPIIQNLPFFQHDLQTTPTLYAGSAQHLCSIGASFGSIRWASSSRFAVLHILSMATPLRQVPP